MSGSCRADCRRCPSAAGATRRPGPASGRPARLPGLGARFAGLQACAARPPACRLEYRGPAKLARYIAAAALVAGGLAGCSTAPPPAPPVAADIVERGPYRLEVVAGPAQLWFGDEFTVRLAVRTPPNVMVQFPDATQFGGLELQADSEPIPRPAENGLIWEQTFRGVSFQAGTLEIPSLTFRYARATADGSEPSYENELVSRPLVLEVRSALTSQDSVLSPRGITGTLAPPPEPLSPARVAVIVTAVLAAIAGGWLLLRWLARRAARPAPPPAPEVWALRELSALAETDWFETGRYKEFYYRLTEIVRAYVEKQFGLAAPEMTTEEFLDRLSRDRDALPYEAGRLRAFLRACDLVKYAAYEPQREDGQQALSTARAFVDATAAAKYQAGSPVRGSAPVGGQAA